MFAFDFVWFFSLSSCSGSGSGADMLENTTNIYDRGMYVWRATQECGRDGDEDRHRQKYRQCSDSKTYL